MMKLPLKLVDSPDFWMVDADGNPVGPSLTKAQAAHIVACVNAFQGVDVSELDGGAFMFENTGNADLIALLEGRIVELEKALQAIIQAPGGGPAKRIATMAL